MRKNMARYGMSALAGAFIFTAASTMPLIPAKTATGNRQTVYELLILRTTQWKQIQAEDSALRVKMAGMQETIERQKRVQIIYQWFKDIGAFENNRCSWITPAHINKVLEYSKRYRIIAKDFNYGVFHPDEFIVLWITRESIFKPNFIKKNKSGYSDYGLCQINAVHKDLFAIIDKMYPHLAKQRPEETEKNIALFYLWLELKRSTGRETCWSIWNSYKSRKDVQELYERLKVVRG